MELRENKEVRYDKRIFPIFFLKYPDSPISDNVRLDQKITRRMSKANALFGRLMGETAEKYT